jgi:hypothetical protein
VVHGNFFFGRTWVDEQNSNKILRYQRCGKQVEIFIWCRFTTLYLIRCKNFAKCWLSSYGPPLPDVAQEKNLFGASLSLWTKILFIFAWLKRFWTSIYFRRLSLPDGSRAQSKISQVCGIGGVVVNPRPRNNKKFALQHFFGTKAHVTHQQAITGEKKKIVFFKNWIATPLSRGNLPLSQLSNTFSTWAPNKKEISLATIYLSKTDVAHQPSITRLGKWKRVIFSKIEQHNPPPFL